MDKAGVLSHRVVELMRQFSNLSWDKNGVPDVPAD